MASSSLWFRGVEYCWEATVRAMTWPQRERRLHSRPPLPAPTYASRILLYRAADDVLVGSVTGPVGNDRTQLYKDVWEQGDGLCCTYLAEHDNQEVKTAPTASVEAIAAWAGADSSPLYGRVFLHIQHRKAKYRGGPTWSLSQKNKDEKCDFNPLEAPHVHISLQDEDGYEVALVRYTPDIVYRAPEEARTLEGTWPFYIIDLDLIQVEHPECILAVNRGYAGSRPEVTRAD